MDVVTGSFGYIGKYITGELLSRGRKVKTISTHPEKPNPFGDIVTAASYNFEVPEILTEYLSGCDVLFNTYWVRFNYRGWSFDQALENTKILFNCVKKAGLKKIVHISVTNPSEDDVLPYYKGKALQEAALKQSDIDYVIIRPTLVFGLEDILVNNIAWTIKRFPFVPVFGSGEYRIQPVYVGDLAMVAVEASESRESQTIDAIGPETYTYKEILQLMCEAFDRPIPLIHMPPSLGITLGKILGLFVRDVILTEDELRGLMANKLTSGHPPNGKTKFSEWLLVNKEHVGQRYTSELKRHFHWTDES